jgi:RES domain-containing protein
MRHEHVPVYRVVRSGWVDPVDTTFSQLATADNRWNTPAFPALYCCCSPAVARAIVRDRFRLSAVDIEDLHDDARPQLVEIHWTGDVSDMATQTGITETGLPRDYPNHVEHSETQRVATEWHSKGAEGIVCRSASLARLGFREWNGDHQSWSELVIFTQNSLVRPSLLKRRRDLDWLGFSNGEEHMGASRS